VTYALVSGCIAAVISLIAGYPIISFLRARKLGKAISADGPQTHLVKAGTPTMGGLLIVGVALAVSLCAALPKDRDVWLPIAVAAVMCAIGWFDDLGTLIDREKREAHDRINMIQKPAGFAIVSAVAAYVLYDRIGAPRLLVPHFGSYDIGLVYVLVVVGVIVSLTSGVAVSDGLDTLTGSTSAVAFAAFGAIALMQHQTGLATLCFAFTGALAGFLWHNAYPARVFMGDTGSLPLGGAMAVVALMTGWWLLVPVIGIVFVAEILADVIQIGSYRLRGGKRVFKMAPLHCHFEQLGIPETRITAHFLLVTVVASMLGVALAALE
jgi:phospho-N-acetylmuramoyl-pentapeptide-transferase